MRDMPNQTYMFSVDTSGKVREVSSRRIGVRDDPDHEARKFVAGEIEAYIMFEDLNKSKDSHLTPEERGIVSRAIRFQAARKRPLAERRESPARRLLAAQIEYIMAVYEINKYKEIKGSFIVPDVETSQFQRLIKEISVTLYSIERQEDVTK